MTTQTGFPLPADLEGFWAWDQVHNPRPVAPLEQEMLVESTGIGFSRAMNDLGSLFGVQVRFINYYAYLTMVPLQDLGGENREERLARYERNVAQLWKNIGDRWDNEWLPKIKQQLEKALGTDYTQMSDDDLLRRFEEMYEEVIDRWTVHGYILYPFVAAGRFADFYRDAVKPEDPNEGYEALQGFPSMALDSTMGLWRLSRDVNANPELREIFDTTRPEELFGRLGHSEAGRAFIQDLMAYLDDFGWRTDSVYELRKPSWREDPAIPLGAIQGYLTIDEAHGPEAQYQMAVDRREELLTAARQKLGGEPEKLQRFEELYEEARRFTPIVDDHNHWIDQMGDITLRYPALELGRRMVGQGTLEDVDGIFMLRRAEIAEGMNGVDKKDVVAERRKEMEHWARVVPPPAIGAPPPPSGDPVEDVIVRFFGVPVEPSTDPAIIKGIAASPGTVQGPAKVVRDLTEASKLNPGDVLVCEMTLPPWTPLFATASAVVADSGGVLSHCAIVAREYRIPCVVGTAVGTTKIKDGMTITVDGTNGIVRIESA